jgi:hypothetical protein
MFGAPALAKIKLRAQQWAELLAGGKLERLGRRQEIA